MGLYAKTFGAKALEMVTDPYPNGAGLSRNDPRLKTLDHVEVRYSGFAIEPGPDYTEYLLYDREGALLASVRKP